MAITFTTLPFEVIPWKGGGIVIEDRKTRQCWRLTNDESRQFVRLIGRQRRVAESLEYHRGFCQPETEPGE